MFEELEEQFGFTQQELEGFHEHFRKIDTGLDGHITHDDLRIKFKAMNVRVSPKILNDLIREVDTNRNGQVEFEEFVRVNFSFSFLFLFLFLFISFDIDLYFEDDCNIYLYFH